jgi:hypothetical protein
VTPYKIPRKKMSRRPSFRIRRLDLMYSKDKVIGRQGHSCTIRGGVHKLSDEALNNLDDKTPMAKGMTRLNI